MGDEPAIGVQLPPCRRNWQLFSSQPRDASRTGRQDLKMFWAFGGLLPRYISIYLPSGKRTKNYGKSPCFMGKLTINGDFQ